MNVGKREPPEFPLAEIWRPVVGFEGRYWISDYGRIWSGLRGGRILTTSLNNCGYPQATLMAPDRTRHQKLIHWLVSEAFRGPTPEGLIIRHLDDDKSNNTLGNLTFGTFSDNNADAIRNGINGQQIKTYCPHGHRYSAANTYKNPNTGHRFCRTCKRRMDADYRARRKTNGA